MVQVLGDGGCFLFWQEGAMGGSSGDVQAGGCYGALVFPRFAWSIRTARGRHVAWLRDCLLG